VDLAQEGNYITLRNAKIDMYRGSMRLAVDQWGKVEALEGSSFQPKVKKAARIWQQVVVAPGRSQL
jgi:replication factor A1